ncbi:uncharacterized protein LOC132718004 [Ruditapes philippinarum]|uniref:uncharacterized protein LOC132718004 n=1 Tax=Ruditapes philippinarum TaxID=129788 RepID=UPI00295B6D73|nr:uncharacterized protein LOC132718004 [Ruditapes philippinarum]
MVLFNYTIGSVGGQLIWKNPDIAKNMILQADSAICVEEYSPEVTTFGCGKPHKVFDLSLMCVYDTDRSGTIIGCRTGSHLQNCGNLSFLTVKICCQEQSTKDKMIRILRIFDANMHAYVRNRRL